MFNGDFNSKTGTGLDFIYFDGNISDTNFDFYANHQFNICNLESLGIPTKRYSEDYTFNNYGYRILDFCKTFDIHIVNGRCGLDRGIGKFTTIKKSVLDYVIMSAELLSCILKFQIIDFDPILSDIHIPITFSLDSNIGVNVSWENTGNTSDADFVEKPIWDNKLKSDFINSFDLEYVQEIIDTLDTMMLESKEVVSRKIDCIVSDISEIFTKANMVKKVKTNKPSMQKSNKEFKKPWYDNDCFDKRSEYLHAKRNFRRLNSQENFEFLKCTSKVYKKETNKKCHDYNKSVNKKLKNLRHSDPKSYWSMLNTFSGEKNKIMC